MFDPQALAILIPASLIGALLGGLGAAAARGYSAKLVATLVADDSPPPPDQPWQPPPMHAPLQRQGSRDYSLSALLGGLGVVLLTLRFGLSTELALGALLSLLLLILALIDQRHFLLPDNLTLPLLWTGLLCNVLGYFASLQDAVIGAVVGYACLWCIFWLFKLLRGKEGLGYGDFKLTAALGAWLGWQALPGIIFAAALAGAGIGLLQVARQKRSSQEPLPFGPFLAAAGFAALCIEGHQLWPLNL